MDFSPETDFQTWYMLVILTIDDGGEIKYLQDDFIRILKYYIDNHTLPPEISQFNNQFIDIMVPEIISHITSHSPSELIEEYTTYFIILISIAKLLVEGLSKDIFEVTKGLSYLFNYEDPFFLSVQQYATQAPIFTQQYKKFCLEFVSNGSLLPLLNRLKSENPKIQHFFHFFRLLSLARVSMNYDDIQCHMLAIKDNLINFINSIDVSDNSSRNIDSNELLFICSFSVNITSDISEFDDLSSVCMNFALKCIKCDFLDKQICGAKLLNKIVEKTGNDNRELLTKFIKEMDIYNIIVSKDYHESVLPHLNVAFDIMTQIEIVPETFNSNLIKIWNKIQNSHFTTKDIWTEMLLEGIINSYDYLDVVNSFLIDYLLNLEQNETTIDVIQKMITSFSNDFLVFSTKLLEFLLSMLDKESTDQCQSDELSNKKTNTSIESDSSNDNDNKDSNVTNESDVSKKSKNGQNLKEILLSSIKKIAITVNISALRNIILNYCRKELLTAVSKNVIEILQYLIEGSSLSSPGVGVNQIVNDNLIDTLICALNSNNNDKKPILDLLTSCYSKISSTPIRMNSKQLSQILKGADENTWLFFDILFDQRNTEFLEKDSLQYFHSYLSDQVDYSKSDQTFVMFLYNFIMAVGISQNKVVKKIQLKNQIRYNIIDTNLDGIEFLSRCLHETENEQAVNQSIDVFLYFISVSRTHANRGKMIEYILTYLLNPRKSKKDNENEEEPLNTRIFILFHKIIMKFEEGIGIEEFDIERHFSFDTSSYIKITINNGLVTLKVNPYISAYSLCQKVAFYLKSAENSVFLYLNNVKLYNSYQLIMQDVKEGSNLRLDKMLLEPCNYYIENVPTFIFCKHNIQNLCLSLLRKNCDSKETAKKKQIWKLLKLLPSMKFDSNDLLIEKIKDAVDEYELLYLLQIALQRKVDCSEVILDLLTNKNEKSKAQTIIKGKAISPAFSILSSSPIQVIEYSDVLLEIISDNFLKTKSIESSMFLLAKICNENNSTVSKFLLGIDYIQLHPDVLLRLTPVFNIIEDASSLFSYLSKYINSIKNDKFCIPFFTLLSVLIKNENCDDYEKALDQCFKLLSEHQNESLVLYGVCIFISILFERVPSLIQIYSNKTATILVPYLLTVTEEKTQKKIESILIKMLNQKETKDLIVSLMKIHFQIIPDRWNYDPSKNVKLIPQLTGLKNLGATCYMNSILQQLYSNSEFRSEFSKFNFDTQKDSNNFCLVELQKLFVRMQMTNLPYLDTKSFCKMFIFQDKRPINVREQQDAIELFQFLIDKFPKPLHDMYEGQIVNTIKGIDVEFESNNYESFYNICLTVKGFDNFEDSFESFLKEEIFSGDNQYYAESIKSKIDARKYSRINKLPNHLVIQLKRFEYNLDTFMKYKVNDRFTFPFEFNAAKYTTNPDDEQIYKLTGIVIHDGIAEAGHYYSLVLIGEKWFCFDDNDVYRYNQHFFNMYVYGQNNNNAPSAYLLFYTKKDSVTKYFIENVIQSLDDNSDEPSEKMESKSKIDIDDEEENDYDYEDNEIQNEHSVNYKDVKLDLFCPPSLKEEIDKENQIYIQMQSSFTYTILHFMSLIDDLETVNLYVLNVFFHSQFSAITKNIPLLSIYGTKCNDYDSNQLVSIISKNSKSFFDVLLHCSVYDQITLYLNFVLFHVRNYKFKNDDSDLNNDSLVILIKEAINSLGFSITGYRSIPYISSLIYFFLEKEEGKKFGLSNNFALIILDFLYKLIETNRASVFWTNLDLHYLFDSLVILKDGFELKSLVNLMNNCNNFLISNNHSRSFIILFMDCYEYDLFISHIFRLFTTQTIGKVIIETLCCCKDEESIKKMLTLFLNQREIIKCDISYNIYFAIEELSMLSSTNLMLSKSSVENVEIEKNKDQPNIVSILMKYKELLLFDFLVCDDDISRTYTEEIIHSLFPSCAQTKASINPFYDFLINSTSSEALMMLKRVEIEPTKVPLQVSSEFDFCHFSEDFVNYTNQLILKDNSLFIKNRLTSAARVMRWMISNIVNNDEQTVNDELLNKLFNLNKLMIEKVIEMSIAYDGNSYELLLTTLMVMLPEYCEHFNEKVDIQKVILKLFPLNSFNRYTLYVSELFLVTFIILLLIATKTENDDLIQIFDNEAFRASFIEFVRKAAPEVIDIFCHLLIDEDDQNNSKFLSQISLKILNILEPNVHQMMIDNVFSIVKVIFSLNIQLPHELFEDLFSFLIVCVEMNIEKSTNESLNEVIFLIQVCLTHIKNQNQINQSLVEKYIPMFIDLYCSQEFNSFHLRFILRDFFGLLCQKNEIIREELIEEIYQFDPFTFDSIALSLRIIREEDDEIVFGNLLHFLLSNILKCLRSSNDECDECFEELNVLINTQKIKLDEKVPSSNENQEESVTESITIWNYFREIARFLLTAFDWKDNTSDFFLFVLNKVNDDELSDLLKTLNHLIHKFLLEESLIKAAFIVENKPEKREFINKALGITLEFSNSWPMACRKYISTFFP
ncbi:hypothetical protein M9Y10_028354 [Tritrichomonas musculus]|uniref:USP domain-containing protein n=1 Tax=Tritrichomonas musculus TaxID=1915356 RepID=A0ABR2KJJ9_9EUKA